MLYFLINNKPILIRSMLAAGIVQEKVDSFHAIYIYIYIYIYTVFHRSIAAATNYFVLQVPEATIRGRRLFEGGVNKRILSYNLLLSLHMNLFHHYSNFVLNNCVHLRSVHLSRSFKLECSIIRPFLRRHFL